MLMLNLGPHKVAKLRRFSWEGQRLPIFTSYIFFLSQRTKKGPVRIGLSDVVVVDVVV